jgi:hypothetical protein
MTLPLRAAVLAGSIIAAFPASAADRSFDLPRFTAIDISSGIIAEVTVGGPQSVMAEAATEGEIDELVIEVRDGRLRAGVEWNLLDIFFRDREIHLRISVPELDEAQASSGASLEVSGLDAERAVLRASSGARLVATGAAGTHFDIEASSGSTISTNGSCGSARASASSGATLQAGMLACTQVSVRVSSGASIEIHASQSAVAKASSGGDITILGGPATLERETRSGGDTIVRY